MKEPPILSRTCAESSSFHVIQKRKPDIMAEAFAKLRELRAGDDAIGPERTRAVASAPWFERLLDAWAQVCGWADRAEMPDEAARNLAYIFRLTLTAHFNHQHAGKHIVRVSPGLSQALMATDFRVRTEDVRLPFPCVYFVFDEPNLVIETPKIGWARGEHERLAVEGAFSWMHRDSDGKLRLGVLILSRPEAFSKVRGERNCAWVAHEWEPGAVVSSDDVQKNEHAPYHEVFKLVVNTALYLSSPDAEQERVEPAAAGLSEQLANVTSSKRRAKLERKLAKANRSPYILVGGSIQRKSAEQRAQEQGGHHWKLGWRVEVRGHWRMQAWGPERMGRRPTWIKPHWRGPDTAALVQRDYYVKREGGRPLPGTPR